MAKEAKTSHKYTPSLNGARACGKGCTAAAYAGFWSLEVVRTSAFEDIFAINSNHSSTKGSIIRLMIRISELETQHHQAWCRVRGFRNLGKENHKMSVFSVEFFCIDTFRIFPSRCILNTVSTSLGLHDVSVGLKENRAL